MRSVLGLVVILAFAWPGSAAAATDARLQGTFQMSGRVTAATHIAGELRGEHVSRQWTFTSRCASGPCPQVRLVRARAGGSDALTLNRRGAGVYSGQGLFYLPVRCNGRVNPRGQAVPFTITVSISAASAASGGPTASAISARYVNPRRVNRTRCVAVPGHDAAVYQGTLAAG